MNKVEPQWVLWLLLASVSPTLAAPADDRTSAAAVLARALDASGGRAAWQAQAALEEQGRIEAGGQEGRYQAVTDIGTGRYAISYQIGLLEGGQGYDGREAWARRPGGDATVVDAAGARAGSLAQAWLVARSYWLGDRKAADLAYLEAVQESDQRYQVLTAKPPGGSELELWFDDATALLARIVTTDALGPQTEFLSDYREVAGVLLPFRRVQRRGDARYDVEIEIEHIAPARHVDDAAFAMPGGTPHDFRFATAARSTTVPFELIANHIYLTVRINGEPLRFMFDSGGVNLLTRTAADALGLEPEGEIEGQGAGENSMPISLVSVAALELGGVALANQTFFVTPLADLGAAHGAAFDGLVGYEVLRRFVVDIDYGNRRLTLSDPDTYLYTGTGEPIELRFADRTPIVEGAIDGIAGEFSIDTGARSSLTLTSPFAARHALLERYAPGAERVVGWGIGGPVMARVGRARTLELGGARVDWPVTALYAGAHGAFADEALAGNIGGGVLHRFRATFDYSRRRMYLEPNAAHDDPDRFDRSGLALKADGEAIIIAHVALDSPASRAGLKAGDRVRQLDGRVVGHAALGNIRNDFVESPSGTQVRVDYERDGTLHTTMLRLADLIAPDPREAGIRQQAAVARAADRR